MSAATSTSTVMVLGGDQEKGGRTVDVERSAALEAFPDQDKDKTDEEKKKIVSHSIQILLRHWILTRKFN